MGLARSTYYDEPQGQPSSRKSTWSGGAASSASARMFSAGAAGHGLPRAGVFGVAPAPITIFTFGMLLMLEGGVPLYLLAIPVLWSLAGGSAAVFILRIPEDVSLLVAGVGCILVWKRRQKSQRFAANCGTHRT